MAKKFMNWKTRGMNRDLSVTAFNPEFAFENRNLRLGTNEGNTLMSWVCEKGTAPIEIVAGNWVDGDDSTYVPKNTLDGVPIGTAIINHKLVIFTIDNEWNHIYVLRYVDKEKTKMICKMLYGSSVNSLNFSIDHPLETIVSYESEDIQKVYWTDGINQPRVINIEGDIVINNSTQFDFVPELQLQETVIVEKKLGASGMFAPGVIQYAFTYYKKNGQESNIFYTTPLYYISHKDRGGSPEDKVDNAFKITVKGVDVNFDYLRIYSIQRTSINATPIVKRIQDVQIKGLSTQAGLYVASYLDTGLSGDSVDPMELLYKGGESISAETIEQKDGTLFLGNISITRPSIKPLEDKIRNDGTNKIVQDTRSFNATSIATGDYAYANQLTSYDSSGEGGGRSVPCGGFKYGDWYRCGVQFQYKSGKWSDPIWLEDVQVTNKPSIADSLSGTGVTVPTLKRVLSSSVVRSLRNAGYRKARAVVVFPGNQDKAVICQGVACPTLYTTEKRTTEGSLHAQSSWFFRSYSTGTGYINADGSVKPVSSGKLTYASKNMSYNPNTIRQVEIQGDYDDKHKFQVDASTLTFHSPDIDFDTSMYSTDFTGMKYNRVGEAKITKTLSDIDIQTESPTISNSGSGFIHKSFSEGGDFGIVSGPFYEDYVIDDYDADDGIAFEKYRREHSPYLYMVYAWNKQGSLNNDINRPSNRGAITAILKKKVISNLRYATTAWSESVYQYTFKATPQLFSSNENTILKLGNDIYQGNVDTMLIPDNADGMYFAFASDNCQQSNVSTPFNTSILWKTFSKNPEEADDPGIWKYANGWQNRDNAVGGDYVDLVMKKEPVRMKYKSTPHLVFETTVDLKSFELNALPIIEIVRDVNHDTIFGGKSQDAFRENIWLPCGEPEALVAGETCTIKYSYGDTYYQRYDCLKTYPYTREDINQIVEIGSFMLETRTNIDGRYDRNRGQVNNLNMSPTNFNLINEVYSQQDNFFTYRIQDDDYYDDTVFPNRITWSKTKESGATTDMWTNVTLASMLELDGDKGSVTSLKRFNDSLICFQDTGISQIMYNPNVQVATNNGVPIEIANSGKVEGKRYFSDTIGCSNKWSIVTTPDGLFFMESNDKTIYRFGGDLLNISVQAGFNTWCKLYIPASDVKWDPTFPVTGKKSAFVSYYDKLNQETLFINASMALAYSHKYNVFTSFYDYNGAPYFCNLDDTGVWLHQGNIWKHQAGDYCRFFGTNRPYSTILIGNPDPQFTKTFTNMEFRACVDGDGQVVDGKFQPYLPFDTLEAWDEYQHGIAFLKNFRGISASMHHKLDNTASLNRKFRIWRCDIPRDNADNTDTFDETFDETFHMLARQAKHPHDRMRNPWLYIRLRKAAADEVNPSGVIYDHLERSEIHDVMMTYFD